MLKIICRSALVVLLVALAAIAAEPPPTVTTNPATALGQTAVTVNGTIHPHGLPTTFRTMK